jgi:hypothetical protein
MDDRIEQLSARLGALEDQIALYQLMSLYGPLVDSGQAERTASLWTEDGVYDWGGGTPEPGAAVAQGPAGAARGRDALAAMVDGPYHRAIIDGGAAHVIGLPHITLDGDTAAAISYSRLYRRERDGFRVWRVAANLWEFVRTETGWQVARRTNRLLDGSDEARALLGRAGETMTA